MLFPKGCIFAVESIQTMVSIFKGKSSISSFLAGPGSISSPVGLDKLSTAQVEGLKPHALEGDCFLTSQHTGSHRFLEFDPQVYITICLVIDELRSQEPWSKLSGTFYMASAQCM